MNGNERKPNGQFAEGNPGGPGRPPRDTERDYLATLAEVVDPDAWREICKRALADAKDGDATARLRGNSRNRRT